MRLDSILEGRTMKPKFIVAFSITFLLVSCLSTPALTPTYTFELSQTRLIPSSTYAPKPTLVDPLLLTPIETPFPAKTFASISSERPKGDLISGTYKVERWDGGYCEIRAVLQPFIMQYEEIMIELFCMRGPPSYNSGYASPQKVLLSNDLAVYSVSEEYLNDIEELTLRHAILCFNLAKI